MGKGVIDTEQTNFKKLSFKLNSKFLNKVIRLNLVKNIITIKLQKFVKRFLFSFSYYKKCNQN